MSNCNNCFNGCTETISDQCIRYTGIDIPNLGIKTGNSLSFVEQVLLTSLLSTLDGRGISIDLSNINICNLVQNYLPAQPPSEGFTLNDILSALIQASCSTQTQLISNYNSINALINTQSTTFADANGAMVSLITNISATMDADRNHTAALIRTEALTRADAISSMASLITNISASVTTNTETVDAFISTYSNTGADSNAALATRIDQLSASFASGNTAALSAAQAAQQSAATALSAANAANLLLIDISSDSKLSPFEKQQIKLQWETIVSEKIKNDAQADSFAVSKTAYGTAYTTLSNYITPLLSDLSTTSDIVGNTFRTNFKNYYDARTDLLNAISSKAKALADGASAAITTESITRATAIGALSSRIDTITASGIDLGFLDSKIDAAIVIERTAAVTREQAIASSLTSLTATVNGHTSSITTNESAIATVNGHLTASYGLAVDANGHIASMNLLSNGISSAIAFTADSFKIFNGTSPITPFTVVDGNVVMTGTTVVDTIVTSGTGPAIGATGWNGLSLNRSSDNLLKFRHPNGVVGMEMGIISGKLVLNWYNDSGVKIWQGGSDGVTAIENSAAAYAGQITNILRIDVNKNGIVSYEGDIDYINYYSRVGAVPTTWSLGVATPGSSGLNSSIVVGLKNPNPGNKFKITIQTSDSFTGNIAAVPSTTIKGYDLNSIMIFDGLSANTTDGMLRSIYVEISTTKY